MKPITKFILTNVEEFAFLIIVLYIVYSMWPELFFIALLVSMIGFSIFVIAKWLILKDVLSNRHYKYEITGEEGIVTDTIAPIGFVRVRGELWRAKSVNNVEIPKGTNVRVIKRIGHTIFVAPINKGETNGE